MSYKAAVLYDLRARRFVLEKKLSESFSIKEISETVEAINNLDIKIENMEIRMGVEPVNGINSNKETA